MANRQGERPRDRLGFGMVICWVGLPLQFEKIRLCGLRIRPPTMDLGLKVLGRCRLNTRYLMRKGIQNPIRYNFTLAFEIHRFPSLHRLRARKYTSFTPSALTCR
jgi:hypothetical protein